MPSESGGELVPAQGRAPLSGEIILPLHYLPRGAGVTQCGKPAVNMRCAQSPGWFATEREYGYTCEICYGDGRYELSR